MQFCYTLCDHEKRWTILLKMTGNVVGPNSVITFMRILPFEAIRTSYWCNVCPYKSVCR